MNFSDVPIFLDSSFVEKSRPNSYYCFTAVAFPSPIDFPPDLRT